MSKLDYGVRRMHILNVSYFLEEGFILDNLSKLLFSVWERVDYVHTSMVTFLLRVSNSLFKDLVQFFDLE